MGSNYHGAFFFKVSTVADLTTFEGSLNIDNTIKEKVFSFVSFKASSNYFVTVVSNDARTVHFEKKMSGFTLL